MICPRGHAGPGQLRAQEIWLGYPEARCGDAMGKVHILGEPKLPVRKGGACAVAFVWAAMVSVSWPSGLRLPGPGLPDPLLPFFLQDGELYSSHCPSA